VDKTKDEVAFATFKKVLPREVKESPVFDLSSDEISLSDIRIFSQLA
jgi:hypothetical protein